MSTGREASGFRHLFLLTDLEGAAGVTHWRQTRECGPEQEAARDLLTGEVNAVVVGLRRAAQARGIEPPKITIWDGHGTGGLHLDRLEEGTVRIRHDDPRGFGGLFEAAVSGDPPVDGLCFIGQHAMEGTGGNLAHTYSSRRVKCHLLNGVEIGELGTRALHAFGLGVPTVFFSGDDVACAEATALIPGLVTVVVKRSRGVTDADCLSHEESCQRLGEAAGKIFDLDRARADLVPCFLPKAPYVYRQIRRAKWGLIPRPNRVFEGDDLAAVLARV